MVRLVIGGRQVSMEPGLPEVPQSPDDGIAESGFLLKLIRDQRVAFLLVGALNTAIGLVAFSILSEFLTIWGGDAAVIGAWLIALPCAFVLHRRFVFRVRGHLLPDLGRFALVNLIPVTVNLVVLPVLTEGFGVPVLLAQVSFTLVWVVGSYFLHRNFSFRRSPVGHGSASPASPVGGPGQ